MCFCSKNVLVLNKRHHNVTYEMLFFILFTRIFKLKMSELNLHVKILPVYRKFYNFLSSITLCVPLN